MTTDPFTKKRRRKEGEELKVAANDAITIHLLRKVDGQVLLEEGSSFAPELTHQLFGEEEEIEGYDGLGIDIWLTPGFQALVDVKYASKADGATDLATPFRELFEAGFFTQKPDFDKALEEEAQLDLAELGEQVAEAATEEGSRFVVLHANLAAASSKLKELHARLQPLLLFFVDAASAIDSSDASWDLFLVAEVAPGAVDIAGFATTYSVYRYPHGSRLRLSQVLVLPLHQGRGVGSLLLKSVVAQADKAGATDLTFEDPTEQLQRMRDKLDLQRALGLGWPREAAEQAVAKALADKGPAQEAGGSSGAGSSSSAAMAPRYLLAPPKELVERLQEELRLSKQHALRVHELVVVLLAAPRKGGEALVEAMVRGRLQADLVAAQKNGAGKVLTDTPSGFVMCKAKGGLVPAGAVEGVSAEEKAAAVEEAVEAQLQQLKAVVAAVAASAQ